MSRVRIITVSAMLAGSFAGAEWLGIARISDPPPPIDGSLARLATSPTTLRWNRMEQIVYGKDKWRGKKDLSGSLFLGWDPANLYVAATVVDDTVVQPYLGSDIYKGDHLEILLDVPRRPVGQRNGKRLVQIGISPGNFAAGDAHVAPEIFQWSPRVSVVKGARIGAKRTADGYRIECAIPWTALGIDTPTEGLTLGIDVALGDADMVVDSGQETLASLLTTRWVLRDPDRMLEAALGDTSGTVDPTRIKTAFVAVAENLRIARGESAAIDVAAVDTMAVRELIVRARLETENQAVAGGTPALVVEVNGVKLGPSYIRNRLKHFDMGPYQMSSSAGTRWFVFYAPDYKPAPISSPYFTPGINPYEFRFDVSTLWLPHGNRVRISHAQPKVANPLVVDVGASKRLSPKMKERILKPAPTGAIPTFEPAGPARPDFTYRPTPKGELAVTLGQRQWRIQSAYSTTAPGWARLTEDGRGVQTQNYHVERSITRHPDHLHVFDRITNTSAEDQPVMVRYTLDAGSDLRTVYIAGYRIETGKSRISTGTHPVSLAMYDDAGIALVSEDDVLRAQGANFREGTKIGIRDDRLVVAKGKSVTLEFSVYPLDTADPFAPINRIRRNWNTNFTIDGSFAFMVQRKPVTTMTDRQLLAQLKGKSATFICSFMGNYASKHGSVWAHGSAFKYIDSTKENVLFKRVKRLQPGTKTFFYYHAFISVHEDDPIRYAADAMRRPDGSRACYGDPLYPLFMPRMGSPFARLQNELIDMHFKLLDIDGIYWDEMAYSMYRYDYGKRWDGVSAIIDPGTHRITRKIANVTLATLSWRLAAARRILKRGMLIGNGAPVTRTFTKLHFPRFQETGSISNLTAGQLYTPIGLGDHLTEKTVVDCYRDMLAGLDYGAVYYWYFDQIVATEPTFTSVMFPITPIELGHGFIIANERILTNRSGMFGWGDASEFDVAVFDRRGRRTDNIAIPRRMKNGKAYAEVRIPEGYGVALIRR